MIRDSGQTMTGACIKSAFLYKQNGFSYMNTCEWLRGVIKYNRLCLLFRNVIL